ncbi:MAG: hypothetical protein LBV18_01970 [Alistipes sp.]|jgi:hypothetical protein|nr:hypothetical protein [Alistipes sp.]
MESLIIQKTRLATSQNRSLLGVNEDFNFVFLLRTLAIQAALDCAQFGVGWRGSAGAGFWIIRGSIKNSPQHECTAGRTNFNVLIMKKNRYPCYRNKSKDLHNKRECVQTYCVGIIKKVRFIRVFYAVGVPRAT